MDNPREAGGGGGAEPSCDGWIAFIPYNPVALLLMLLCLLLRSFSRSGSLIRREIHTYIPWTCPAGNPFIRASFLRIHYCVQFCCVVVVVNLCCLVRTFHVFGNLLRCKRQAYFKSARHVTDRILPCQCCACSFRILCPALPSLPGSGSGPFSFLSPATSFVWSLFLSMYNSVQFHAVALVLCLLIRSLYQSGSSLCRNTYLVG